MKVKKFALTLLASTAVLFAGSASAALVVAYSPSNQDTENVLSNACTPGTTIKGPATLVQGCLNQDNSTIVNFKSNENLRIKGGQSTITAVDGGFSQLSIFLDEANATFAKLVLNIFSSVDGFVTFFGTPGGSTGPLALSGNGSNFFTITGDAGEGFSSISFETTGSVVTDLRQVRIGGVGSSEVPEPATLALMGAALLGFAASRKRKA